MMKTLMSPSFAHSRKHVLFAIACLIRSFVTGWAPGDRIVLSVQDHSQTASTRTKSSLYRSVSIFTRVLRKFEIKNDPWRPKRRCTFPERLSPAVSRQVKRTAAWRNWKHVNSLAKCILSKDASAQRGEKNVQRVEAEIILQQPAQFRLQSVQSKGWIFI